MMKQKSANDYAAKGAVSILENNVQATATVGSIINVLLGGILIFSKSNPIKFATDLPDSLNTEILLMKPIISKINEYFSGYPVKHDVAVSSFVDPEYPDWQEIKLTIFVDTNLKQLYEDIKPSIYKIVEENMPEHLTDQIVIKFEIMK